jgi:ssRNA-specific RNase YbeY (16S rRNA maturation enzyme)
MHVIALYISEHTDGTLLSSLLHLHGYDHHEEPGKRRDARRGRCQEGSPRGRLT